MITTVRENEITDIPSRISQTRKCKAVTAHTDRIVSEVLLLLFSKQEWVR